MCSYQESGQIREISSRDCFMKTFLILNISKDAGNIQILEFVPLVSVTTFSTFQFKKLGQSQWTSVLCCGHPHFERFVPTCTDMDTTKSMGMYSVPFKSPEKRGFPLLGVNCQCIQHIKLVILWSCSCLSSESKMRFK